MSNEAIVVATDGKLANLDNRYLQRGDNLSDISSTATARTNLGLGTVATQDSTNVDISGGVITGMPAPTAPSDVATKAYVDAGGGGGGGSSTNSQLVAGGGFTYLGLLQFRASAATYTIGGVEYSSPETDITLAAADGSHPRIDIFVYTSLNTVIAIKGAAAANPAVPTYDPGTQLYAGYSVEIPTSATSITAATNTLVYDEDAGTGGTPAEFDVTDSGSGWTLGSTANPLTGTKNIRKVASGGLAGDYVAFAPAAPIDLGSYSGGILSFPISVTTAWANKRGLAIRFMSGTATVGIQINILNGSFGFNASLLATYQTLAIPLSQFQIPAGTTFDSFRIILVGGGTAFDLDNIRIQGGAVTVGLTIAQLNALYLQRANNLSDVASASSSRTNLGLGTAAVHADTEYVRVDGTHAFSADQAMGLHKITGLADAVAQTDAVTLQQLESVAAGFSQRTVRLASAGAPAAYTYTNGVSGVGGLVTFNGIGSQSVDGSATVAGDRLLLKDGAAGADNGIYVVTTKGGAGAEIWTRAADANQSADFNGSLVIVEAGTANIGSLWLCSTPNPAIGTDTITFVAFSVVSVKVPFRTGFTFFEAFTPTGTGGDAAEWVVPYSPKDGTTVLTYNLRTLYLRIAGKQASVTSSVRLEKSGAAAHAAFGSVTNMQTGGDLSLGSSVFDGVNNTWSTATVQSGDVLRINWTAIGAGDVNATCSLQLESTAGI